MDIMLIILKLILCDNSKEFYKVENTNNCEKSPYPGHYLDGDTLRKCHIACDSCSEKAIINEKGEVTNCDTCNKDLGFYPVDDTKVCRNTTKEGEYFDEDCKCYKKCYKDCLTCSGKEIDQYHMNCLTCDTSKGYTYFTKTTNCLNCKALGKYVNYEQTECIDSVPDGYYVNDTNTNTIDLCYIKCKTCSGYGDETTMNCITCQPSLYLKDKNCVKTYTCPYKYFYQIKIDKNADMNQKICLDQNEICPCALPFYYTHSNECVETCPIELLLYQGCKISNLPYGLNKVILLVKLYYSQGLINYLTKSFSISDINYLYELAVKISVYSLFSSYSFFRNLEITNNTYQSLSNDNITTMGDSNYFEGSDINLGSCESKLREYYNIPEDVQLTIIKLDFKKNDSSVNNVQYEVFNPKNRTERLDLNICKEEKVVVKNPIDSSISLNRISHLMDSSDNSMDIFSEDNKFYTDECSLFTSEDNTDVLIQDRILEYNYKNKICQNGCQLEKINVTTGEAFCSCQPNKGFVNISISNIEEIMNENNLVENNDNIEQVKNQKYSGINAKILKCSKNIRVGFFKNYILVTFTLIVIAYISISIIFIKFKEKFFKTLKRIKERSPHERVGEKKDKNSSLSTDDRLKNKAKSQIKQSTLDIDIYEFNKVKEKNDKERSFIQKLFSSLKTRLIIFSCFDNKDMLIIKILLLIYAISNYIVTNAFFFTEKNIHQIYLDKGAYNFNYQLKYIILATLISAVFLYIAKFFATVKKPFEDEKIPNSYERSLYIFIGVSNCLLIFYWVYLGSLTSTYINSKIHLLINAIVTFLFSCVLDFILALISVILRIISLKKDKKLLYKISKIINCL